MRRYACCSTQKYLETFDAEMSRILNKKAKKHSRTIWQGDLPMSYVFFSLSWFVYFMTCTGIIHHAEMKCVLKLRHDIDLVLQANDNI